MAGMQKITPEITESDFISVILLYSYFKTNPTGQ